MANDDYISAGEVSGVFGVKGGVKVFSFTQPRENILRYSPWLLQKNNQIKELKVVGGQRQGNLVVAELEGISDRDQAFALIGWSISIKREQLPKPKADEYYWVDLVGLEVETDLGVKLGKVDHLLETGANDVLVVVDGKVERLIPFLQPQTVLKVDLANQLLVVDWDPDF